MADTREKQTLGNLWESRSEGRCLFVMLMDRELDVIRSKTAGRV